MTIVWDPGLRPVMGALLRVPKALVDGDRLRSSLTVTNPRFFQQRNAGLPTTEEPTLELFRETDSSFLVPRHYRLPKAVRRLTLDYRRTRGGEDLDGGHVIELRDHVQEEAADALLATNDDKIISLACGKGKTVVSLYSAAEGDRLPALVVVHTNALMDQWRERIREFYGLEDDEIGHVQGKVEDWRGKKIAIAMLHSLCLKRYDKAFYKYWRLIIFDETHKLGANMFQKAAGMFPGERWGLSATVEREDKMDRVFRMHLGEVVYENLEQPLQPKVYFVNSGITCDLSKFIFRGGRVNMGRLQTWLGEHRKRNRLIYKYVLRLAESGRTVLVLGERLTQLYDLHEALTAAGVDSAVHVGAMKKDERAEALRHQVVCATQQLAKEGLDRPAFDTLIITVPFGGAGRLQQSIGRILRLHDGKKPPRVLVFEDSISIVRALANKMRRTLREMGFKSHNVERK